MLPLPPPHGSLGEVFPLRAGLGSLSRTRERGLKSTAPDAIPPLVRPPTGGEGTKETWRA
jgi:hypothetical protein